MFAVMDFIMGISIDIIMIIIIRGMKVSIIVFMSNVLGLTDAEPG